MSPFIEPLIGPLIIEPGIKSMEKKYQKKNHSYSYCT